MKILVVVESINIEDSSGSKANVALIKNLAQAGFEVLVYHYTLKQIQIEGIKCVAISEIKFSPLYALSRLQRIISRNFKINLAPFFEGKFGFSFTFFNDTNSIVKSLKSIDFKPDLVFTLSKGSSFRPHYALLKITKWHSIWMAYVHDPYPFHLYPKPFKYTQPGHKIKENFFKAVSEKAKFSSFPSLLLQDWMAGFFPNFKKTGFVIPHQNAIYEIQNNILPNYFDETKFNLLHAGNLLAERNPKGLLEGFLLFLKNNDAAKTDSRLFLLGHAQSHAQLLQNYISNQPEIYIHIGNIPFDQVYLLQQKAAVNFILESKADISPFLPAKFPHCVAANKIIFSLSPHKSEVHRLLGDDYEFWSEVDDVEKIASLIEKLYQSWKQNPDNLFLNRKDLENYLSVSYLKDVFCVLKGL